MEHFKAFKSISYFFLVPLFSYTGISAELTAILAVLICVDILTALIREYAVGNHIKSRTLWIGISAKMLLLIIPFIVILVGKGAGVELLSMGRITISILIIAEGYSIIGNIGQIRKKDVTIDEQDVITSVIKNIEKVFKNLLGSLMKK
jgi:hypothetical protein